MYRVARTTDFETCSLLHRDLLPGDAMPRRKSTWWLAKAKDGTPVGFAAAYMLESEHAVFIARVGVYKHARGHGLQRRMLRARERWGRQHGATHAVTYTYRLGASSMNNLIRAGYRTFYPHTRWAGPDMVYWIKAL